jgi:hypothetical protein
MLNKYFNIELCSFFYSHTNERNLTWHDEALGLAQIGLSAEKKIMFLLFSFTL